MTDPLRTQSTTETGERAANAARVAELYAQGLNGCQIASATGLSRSYTYELLHDPDGTEARERKTRYSGKCVDCGGPTYGGDGEFAAPKRCLECSRAHLSATKKWTEQAVIEALQTWARLYGKPPTSTDFNVAHPQHKGERAERWASGDYPHLSTVTDMFGGWNAALQAVGLKTQAAYGYRGLSEEAQTKTRALFEEGLPIAEIARRCGVTQNAIVGRLKRLGINPYRGVKTMPASLKAEQVLDREIERADARVERLRTELADAENTSAKLKEAREVLTAPAIKAVA